VAARVVREHYRWRKVRRLRAWIVEHSWAGRSIQEGTPETNALSSEASERVHRVLQAMSAKLRDALVLTDLEELGTREAAEILAIPHNTLRSRHRLAREQFLRLWQASESLAPREP
jgi:RNA polymerase sigma factor (sigma-70 family)